MQLEDDDRPCDQWVHTSKFYKSDDPGVSDRRSSRQKDCTATCEKTIGKMRIVSLSLGSSGCQS